ncbi:serine/threonine protein kinase [Nonomuraea mesophila]|uniref:non-specific serine/threonine protein kinase n=1 Tax=Nonomuraea mesophila TaxID=2530382 RepID=A0A4R5FJ56_9ACTN|nr:serine/threonine-protein kinase [Nonomuraea mesophila]TDE51482.1 serine/threonine protein kinase [Nonomuraea mesophila]
MTAPSHAGRYRIEQIIGVGGFASVHLAHDDELRSPVAVKILADNWARKTDVRERFLQEARLLRRADSHLLVQVFDIGELDDGRPYFVMTYADRGTLAERLASRPLPVDEALGLMRDICRGVAVLHSIGVVHRDLKPSNVLFCSRPEGGERVMVADLGIARSTDHLSGLTLPAGSPGYQAPEQLYFDGAPDARADVHGLGALAYHLLTGQVPGKPEHRVPPSALNPEVPEVVDVAVMRAIEPGRETRWPDAAAFAAALASSTVPEAAPPPAPRDAAHAPLPAPRDAAHVPPPEEEPEEDGTSPSARRRPGRRTVVVAGAGVVVVAAAATAMALASSPPVDPPPGTDTPTATPLTNAWTAAYLRADSDIPDEYRELIVQAGTYCELPGLSPALIAAMLKAESGYDPDLSDKANDEYGIARWTPGVLWHWQPGGLQRPKPSPPFTPELSILSIGRFMCRLGPRVTELPGDPALKLAALYRSGVDPLKEAKGVPPRWRDYTAKVARYMRDYQPA